MARKAMRAARPLGLVALGWALACLYIFGPRVAVNRGLDLGYSLAGWAGSFFCAARACAFRLRKFSRSAAASRSAFS